MGNSVGSTDIAILVSQARPLYFFLATDWVGKKGSGDTPLANLFSFLLACYVSTVDSQSLDISARLVMAENLLSFENSLISLLRICFFMELDLPEL